MHSRIGSILLLKILLFTFISHAKGSPCETVVDETILVGNCKGMLRHGKFLGYHKNGLLHWEVHYKNDVLHGKFRRFYPNGNLHFSGSYKNGRLYGNFKQYNHKNEVLNTTFKHDVLHDWLFVTNENKQKMQGYKFYYGKLIQHMYFD